MIKYTFNNPNTSYWGLCVGRIAPRLIGECPVDLTPKNGQALPRIGRLSKNIFLSTSTPPLKKSVWDEIWPCSKHGVYIKINTKLSNISRRSNMLIWTMRKFCPKGSYQSLLHELQRLDIIWRYKLRVTYPVIGWVLQLRFADGFSMIPNNFPIITCLFLFVENSNTRV